MDAEDFFPGCCSEDEELEFHNKYCRGRHNNDDYDYGESNNSPLSPSGLSYGYYNSSNPNYVSPTYGARNNSEWNYYKGWED